MAERVMPRTIAELLALEPQEVTLDLRYLNCPYRAFVPELEFRLGFYEYDLSQKKPNERITSRVYKHFDFDHRRFWRLASIHLDGECVMVTQNAGREGDDFARRIVVNADLYKQMVVYLNELFPPKVEDPEVTPIDEPVENLCTFYNNELFGYFEVNRF